MTTGTTFKGHSYIFINGTWKIRENEEEKKEKKKTFVLDELTDEEVPIDDYILNPDFGMC